MNCKKNCNSCKVLCFEKNMLCPDCGKVLISNTGKKLFACMACSWSFVKGVKKHEKSEIIERKQ